MQVVIRFDQALRAGREYSDGAWLQWQKAHKCEPPPPKDLSEAVMVGGMRIGATRGTGSSSQGYGTPAAMGTGYGPSSGGGGGKAKPTDICYRCSQPGHWGANCPVYNNGRQQGGSHGRPKLSATQQQQEPQPQPQEQQQQQRRPAKRRRRAVGASAALAALVSGRPIKAGAITSFFQPINKKKGSGL